MLSCILLGFAVLMFLSIFIGAVAGNLVARKDFPIKEACLNSKARNFQSLEVKV